VSDAESLPGCGTLAAFFGSLIMLVLVVTSADLGAFQTTVIEKRAGVVADYVIGVESRFGTCHAAVPRSEFKWLKIGDRVTIEGRRIRLLNFVICRRPAESGKETL